jgi:hypothetical protein
MPGIGEAIDGAVQQAAQHAKGSGIRHRAQFGFARRRPAAKVGATGLRGTWMAKAGFDGAQRGIGG